MFKSIDKKTWVIIGVLFVVLILTTWLLRIDIPYESSAELKLTAGYVTLGDVCIYISAMFLSAPFAVAICAIGGLIADLLAGHAGYALASFVIKGIAAYVAYYLLKRADTFMKKVYAIVVSGVWMIIAYFIFDFVIRGNYVLAAVALPFHILQLIACGAIASLVLFLASGKTYQKKGEGEASFSFDTSKRNLK